MTNIAIVGATGVVGRTMLSILEERDFPVGSIRLMASARSAGSKIETQWGEVEVEDLDMADPSGIDVALFSAGGDRSRQHAPRFAEAGATVIDNSSAFRRDPEIPLVVAGVNDHHIASHTGIIANPNCTTMALMVAAGPLHKAAGIRSMVVSGSFGIRCGRDRRDAPPDPSASRGSRGPACRRLEGPRLGRVRSAHRFQRAAVCRQ